MYNSVLIGVLVRVWTWIERAYEYSILSKLVGGISRGFSFLLKGSVIRSIFGEEKDILENTFIYRMYGKLLGVYEGVIGKFNSFVSRTRKQSFTLRNIDSLFKDNSGLVRTILVFLTSFIIGIVGIGMVWNRNIRILHIILILFCGVLLIIAEKSEALLGYLDYSGIYRWIVSFFSTEEGEDQWW